MILFIHSLHVFEHLILDPPLALGGIEVTVSDISSSSISLESGSEDRSNYIKYFAHFPMRSESSVFTGAYQLLFSIILVTQVGTGKMEEIHSNLSANTVTSADVV